MRPCARRMLFALLVALAAPGASAGAGHAAPALPRIELGPRGAEWLAAYRFDAPVREMRFARPDARGRRAAGWRVVEPGLALTLEDGEEVLRRRDGGAFDRATLRVPPRYEVLDKDYAPFSPFSDGGVLIHTGRFFACAPRCDGADAPAWRFRVRAPAGQSLLHAGRAQGRRAAFVERDSGSKLYVGPGRVLETPHLLAVLDPALPATTLGMLEQLLPRLLDYYAARLGALPAKPMLFASYDAAHAGGGYGHQGGTLPGQVFMHFYGRLPADRDLRQDAAQLRAFFAHEAAHLFQHVTADDPDDAWLHEGGAEAFAVLALRALGELDEAQAGAQRRAAWRECAAGLAGIALRESAARGAFGNYYRCGLLMQLAVDAAARRASGGRCDGFCVWRAFQARRDAGAPFDAETYFDAVAASADARTAAFLRRAAAERLEAPAAFFAHGLDQAGLPVDAREAP